MLLSLLFLLALHMVFFPCWHFTWSSFPAGTSHGLLSLLALHIVFFPCWHFTWSSFSAGTSHNLLSLLIRCFTWAFCADASHGLLFLFVLHKFLSLKFCYNNQTKWPPFIDISQATISSTGYLFEFCPLAKNCNKIL